MPAFRFEFSRDVARETVAGIELDGIDAAVAQAKQAARESMIDGVIEGIDTRDWVVRVFDPAGYLVTTIHFAELLRKEEEDAAEPPSGAV